MALEFETSTAVEATKRKTGFAEIEVSLPWQSGAPSLTDRMFFTEQLALLLESGESLVEALHAITRQTVNPRMRTVVEAISNDISEGQTFASALAAHDKVFSSTYVNLIAASEQGGFMFDVLQQLLDMDRKSESLRATLVSAATYPLFLITFSLAVVVFVLVVVFPKFGTLFTSIYDQLPATTKILMAASDVLRNYWILICGSIVAMVVGLRTWLQGDVGNATIDHWKLHWPGLRSLYSQIYLVQSMRVMSLSLANGVSVMESLEACRDVVGNSVFRTLIERVEARVQSGAGVAVGFAEAHFLPDLAKHMIATGERTGNLGKVMGRMAQYYEVQLAKKLDALTKLAEPVMLLVMGVIVGVLVSSLILPIFKLSRAVS